MRNVLRKRHPLASMLLPLSNNLLLKVEIAIIYIYIYISNQYPKNQHVSREISTFTGVL